MTTSPSDSLPAFPAGLSLRTGLLLAAAAVAACVGCSALKPGGDDQPWALPLFQSGDRREPEPVFERPPEG